MPFTNTSMSYQTHQRPRWWMCAVLLCMFFVFGTERCHAQQIVDRTAEYNVKGVYVYNFGRYITWPANVKTPTGKFVVGIVGDSDIATPLSKLAKVKKITDRRTNKALTLTLKHIRTIDDYEPCHILFVPNSTDPEIAAYLVNHLKEQPVFLIGESAEFPRSGGGAGFVISNGSVRFDVNIADAQKKGLIIDAKLLKAANDIVQPTDQSVSIQR